jgi:hypothetical protein
MNNDYAASQSAKNARYKREYEAWIAGLSPKERARFEAKGLAAPCVDDQPASHCGLTLDIAESPVASDCFDIAEAIDPETATKPGGILSDEALWDIVRRLLGEILGMQNRSLTVECLAVVSGLSYVGDSMCEIASRHGVTRAAVSKRCVELSERLSLPPSRAMRSLTARKSYRAAQIRLRKSYEP